MLVMMVWVDIVFWIGQSLFFVDWDVVFVGIWIVFYILKKGEMVVQVYGLIVLQLKKLNGFCIFVCGFDYLQVGDEFDVLVVLLIGGKGDNNCYDVCGLFVVDWENEDVQVQQMVGMVLQVGSFFVSYLDGQVVVGMVIVIFGCLICLG